MNNKNRVVAGRLRYRGYTNTKRKAPGFKEPTRMPVRVRAPAERRPKPLRAEKKSQLRKKLAARAG